MLIDLTIYFPIQIVQEVFVSDGCVYILSVTIVGGGVGDCCWNNNNNNKLYSDYIYIYIYIYSS